MPFTLMEGFEDEATASYLSVSAADTEFDEVAGENSRGFALQRNTSTSGEFVHSHTPAASVVTIALGLRFYNAGNGNSTNPLITVQEDGTFPGSGSVSIDPTSGNLSMTRGGSYETEVQALSVAGAVPIGQWSMIEALWRLQPSTDTADLLLYVNGVYLGMGTLGSMDGTRWLSAKFTFGFNQSWQGNRWDDLWIWESTTEDATPPSPFPYGTRLHIDRLLPDADGALTDWSGGSGAAAAMDDDDPTGSTGTSISSVTSTDQESVSVGPLPVTPTQILAVQYDVWAQGSGAVLDPLWRSSGGSVGTDTTNTLGLAASWGGARTIVETNPQTATAWTPADVSTGEFGFELE